MCFRGTSYVLKRCGVMAALAVGGSLLVLQVRAACRPGCTVSCVLFPQVCRTHVCQGEPVGQRRSRQ